jgi:DNA-directed RNA polymerase subunit RPC12/RpoP
MVQQHSCMCMQCGRAFQIVLEAGKSVDDGVNCPICGGANVVAHNPNNFFNQIFGSGGG